MASFFLSSLEKESDFLKGGI